MRRYLLRFVETGRDAQRRKQARDLEAVVRAQLPDVQIEAGAGRLYLSTEHDADGVLAALHGIRSYSPCDLISIDALTAIDVDPGEAKTFAVRVKRSGEHAFSSLEMARSVAAFLVARHPQLRVDLKHPELTVGIEIRGSRAWIFTQVIPGVDVRGAELPSSDGPVRFAADQMLGRLAAWLRMVGFDTTYAFDIPDSELSRRANQEGRIILTRDRPLSRNRAARVLYVHARDTSSQLREVMDALHLTVRRRDLMSRCARCNSALVPVDKASIRDRVPPAAFARNDAFARCPKCDQIFWAGSHFQRVLEALGPRVTD